MNLRFFGHADMTFNWPLPGRNRDLREKLYGCLRFHFRLSAMWQEFFRPPTPEQRALITSYFEEEAPLDIDSIGYAQESVLAKHGARPRASLRERIRFANLFRNRNQFSISGA